MKTLRVVTVLVVACTAHAASLRMVPVRFNDNAVPPAVHIYCATDYNRESCVTDAATLRKTLAIYPLQILDDWSFVLSPSGENWKDTVRQLGGNPSSPAFTIVDQHLTVFEAALFSGNPGRTAELIRIFGVAHDELLRIAVSHELGHVLCHDLDEQNAEQFGIQLRAKRAGVCRNVNRVKRSER